MDISQLNSGPKPGVYNNDACNSQGLQQQMSTEVPIALGVISFAPGLALGLLKG